MAALEYNQAFSVENAFEETGVLAVLQPRLLKLCASLVLRSAESLPLRRAPRREVTGVSRWPQHSQGGSNWSGGIEAWEWVAEVLSLDCLLPAVIRALLPLRICRWNVWNANFVNNPA